MWIEGRWRRAVEGVWSSSGGAAQVRLVQFGRRETMHAMMSQQPSASGEGGLFGGCMMIAQAGGVLLLCRRRCVRWIVSKCSAYAEGERWCRWWSFSIVWTANTPPRARMLRGAARCCCGEPSERKSVQERSHVRRELLFFGQQRCCVFGRRDDWMSSLLAVAVSWGLGGCQREEGTSVADGGTPGTDGVYSGYQRERASSSSGSRFVSGHAHIPNGCQLL